MLCAAVVLFNITPSRVDAQTGVVPYDARYVFIGTETEPAIFDTGLGVYRVWSPKGTKTVTTYNFNVHKVVQIDSISIR